MTFVKQDSVQDNTDFCPNNLNFKQMHGRSFCLFAGCWITVGIVFHPNKN